MTKNFCTFAVQNPRKDAGVVDRDGLENRCTLTGTQGSNPCLSAKKQPSRLLFLHRKGGMRTLEGFVIAQRSAKQRLPVFPQKSRKFGAFDSRKPTSPPSTCRVATCRDCNLAEHI